VGDGRERTDDPAADPAAGPVATPRDPARSASVLGRGLGRELARHRERAGLTRELAARAGGVPATTIEQLEAGRLAVGRRTLADLLTRYGVLDEDERADLLAVARRAADPGWWHAFTDIVPQQYETYLRLEQAASVIRSYDPHVVPRLLQTREYATATVRLAFARLGTTHLGITRTRDVDRQIDIRMHRQRLLDAPDGPTLWATVDESVLRRPAGGPGVARAQLTHLLEITERPRVVLQVLRAGPAAPITPIAPLTLMRFAQPYLPDVGFVEQTTRPLCLEKRSDVEHYSMVMDRLAARAEPATRTPTILAGIRADL
jgi:transcriptional regulator with XRE-family HTH domain